MGKPGVLIQSREGGDSAVLHFNYQHQKVTWRYMKNWSLLCDPQRTDEREIGGQRRLGTFANADENSGVKAAFYDQGSKQHLKETLIDATDDDGC